VDRHLTRADCRPDALIKPGSLRWWIRIWRRAAASHQMGSRGRYRARGCIPRVGASGVERRDRVSGNAGTGPLVLSPSRRLLHSTKRKHLGRGADVAARWQMRKSPAPRRRPGRPCCAHAKGAALATGTPGQKRQSPSRRADRGCAVRCGGRSRPISVGLQLPRRQSSCGPVCW